MQIEAMLCNYCRFWLHAKRDSVCVDSAPEQPVPVAPGSVVATNSRVCATRTGSGCAERGTLQHFSWPPPELLPAATGSSAAVTDYRYAPQCYTAENYTSIAQLFNRLLVLYYGSTYMQNIW